MFSSNQIFSISADCADSKALKETISLILKGFCFSISSYKITDDGKLIFYSFERESDKTYPICKEDVTVEYIVNLVSLYLSSNSYKKAIKDRLFLEGGDGSIYEGWKCTIDNSTLSEKIVFEPFWCFYHK